MRSHGRGLLLALACALAAACGKAPAEQAVKAAEAALEAAKPELQKYVPAQLQDLSGALSHARAEFEKGEYKQALASAQQLLAQIGPAVEAARKKKEQLMAAFEELKLRLPATLKALKTRLAALGAMKRLPAGLDKAKLAAGQSDLGSVGQSWNEALAHFDRGDMIQAVDGAMRVKAKLEELTQSFQPAPAPAPASQ